MSDGGAVEDATKKFEQLWAEAPSAVINASNKEAAEGFFKMGYGNGMEYANTLLKSKIRPNNDPNAG